MKKELYQGLHPLSIIPAAMLKGKVLFIKREMEF